MKGWYCIYECSEGKWLMQNQWWSHDWAMHTESLPTKWDVVLTTITEPNWSTKPLIQMRGNDYKDIVIMDTNHKTSPYSILRFETMGEAEAHLVSNPFSTDNGKFYSIRKIYM